MAITKTSFINYSRCPRYCSLDELKKEKLDSNVSLQEYKKEEESQLISELLSSMYDEDDNDLIDIKNEHLEIMLPFYNEVEVLAGKLCPTYFKGTFKYAKKTNEQESFDCKINGIRYLCYVDIYNEVADKFNIIEVKATTIKKYLNLGKTVTDEYGNKRVNSIFMKNHDNIYYLLEDMSVNIEDYMDMEKYYKYKDHLFNKFDAAGRYVYDLAVQRYIIENDLRQNGMENKIAHIKYYLAVLNSEYVFNGNILNNNPIFNKDEFGNDIVCFIDLTSVTKDYLDKIDLDRKRVEGYINDLNIDRVPVGEYCENKKTTKCKFFNICWDFIPNKNSILNYIDNHHGFKDQDGNKYDRYDLINSGIVNMLDVPVNYLNREKNIIQRDVVKNNKTYINIDKIKSGLECITYPIYHLDFETFPCPIPRYKGERCYSQSVFQFSLHIERKPGLCDKDKDHYEYLAKDHNDNREQLIKKMIEWIDVDSGGTILVYNESFEKTRLKELGEIFPEYKQKLKKMSNMIFDLMYIIKTNSTLYKELGYSEEESKMFNYYHSDMSGSFSIKKILPLFSDLTYKGMEVGNGIDALITYAKFPKLSELDYEHKYKKLVEYCKQDTWAMVEILRGLRSIVK